ncbi:MAG TPA: ABC transporter permease subunit [Acidimicrobiales bacterium]|nr:ABC transporter permease subunit [Acidimicrobiales bacterium]
MSDLVVEAGLPVGLVGASDQDRAARRGTRTPWLGGVIGITALLVVWDLLALYVFQGKHIMPTPTGVLRGLWDNRTLLQENAGITIAEAAQGWLWGNALAIALALVFIISPPVEAALLRLAIASYCMPIIAVAPILNIVFSGDKPKVVLAAMSVFFTTLVGMSAGLRSADPVSLDVIRAYGGSSWTAMVKVRIRAALPNLFAALRIAAPAAVLGAIIGEYLGGTHGIGVAMINAEQSLDVTRVWTLALFAAGLAGVGYAATGVVARLATPWAKGQTASVGGTAGGGRSRGRTYRAARSVTFLAGSIGVTLLCWVGFVKLFHLNSYFAKTPADVWQYLTQGSAASGNRAELWHAMAATLGDASLGYVFGTVLAVMAAMAMVSYRTVEAAFMPVAVVLRSVPLIAMTPLIALALGRGLVSVTVIAGIVTFFPTLVNVVHGLRSASHDSILLMRAFDASELTTLFKVRVPSALPSLFSSARIAAPGALLGAVLAEWLSTGKGLGYLMLEASTESRFDTLWSGVVLITVASVVIYAIVGLIEIPVLKRFGSAG